MKRYFCDICKKEEEELTRLYITTTGSMSYGESKTIELCSECADKAGFGEKDYTGRRIMPPQDKFYELLVEIARGA